ncbi:homospermidine synthase [Tistlia consotensis]|uniref:Homospermidine synthase n=1 Tax=Tistlia consotensis USBA 355 TaxID=560819 RepID=A0A1Y6C7R0_9PROT|nr:saccharopine dehydrogenase C-terminal domain-containing protein [Tistlia consotensis]SMF40561.1 homospermidine synthase [Tistlia consotensis USBA 355]SNR74763.1 homospermidine synthase [Tistlia consotensis]
MAEPTKYLAFTHRLVMVGFGSIGQGVLPLIMRHLEIRPEQIQILCPDESGLAVAEEYGIGFRRVALTPDNYRAQLEPLLGPGDFLLNLSVDVSSVALFSFAAERGALYLDTCIEPWLGGYTDASAAPAERTNYALREKALEAGRKLGADAPTCVLTHGANPGLVSHFAKQALLDIARDTGTETGNPAGQAGWSDLARRLGVKVIHVAERDTQVPTTPKRPGEFVNTWSVDGFYSEGCQPAELGWGTHEKGLPADGRRHDSGSDAAIYLLRPGASTRVRTWTPLAGPINGFLITHNESISLADYLTVRDGGKAVYRPTVHYAYHPCDSAVLSVHELSGRQWQMQEAKRLIVDEVQPGGIDELGVLLCGHGRNAYWYGSQLSVDEARRLAPHNNATSLQVTIPVFAGLVWACENPKRGLVEPEQMDHERILEICRPYLGPVVGVYGDWTPLHRREELFAEDIDRDDPWQFKNIRVV